MALMVVVAVNGDRDRGGGGEVAVMTGTTEVAETVKEATVSGADWEVEQVKGMDGEETLLTMVELGTEVTVESI
jgi:hypothetical protein